MISVRNQAYCFLLAELYYNVLKTSVWDAILMVKTITVKDKRKTFASVSLWFAIKCISMIRQGHKLCRL